jgi:non-specific serine/threonine protein kinase
MSDSSSINWPTSDIVGRKHDLAELTRIVTDPAVRLVTICGAGGIGKTRLTQEMVRTVAGDFADGVIFVDLVPLSDAQLIPEKIAATLQFSVPDGATMHDAIIRHLEAKNLLIVLDNMEQLLQGIRFIQTLLGNCPELVILATSRERLGLPNEHVFELGPLAVPDQHGPRTADAIGANEAAQLFILRAQAADRTFALTDQNAPDIAAICRRLDGLPLAIELAASRVAEIPPHLILHNFVRILPFLERSAHDPNGRHRTMRNAIAWSFESLPVEEQTLFTRLSVFQSRFALDGAMAVGHFDRGDTCSDPVACEIRLLGTLGSLVSKHLLLRYDWSGDTPRYGILQTMREYGQEQLGTTGQEQAARDAHAGYLTELADRLRHELRGPDPAPALARYSLELDEFRAALAWLISSRPKGDLAAINLCNCLANFWLWRGHAREGARWYQSALDQAGDADTIEHATAYLQLGHFTFDDLSQAFTFYQTSHGMFERLGHRIGTAGLLSCLGMTSEKLGDFDEADAYLTESLRIFEELGDDNGVANTTYHLGTLAGSRGNFAQATAYLDRSRGICDRAGDTTNAVFATYEMGRLHRIEGRYREAEQLLRWSLTRLIDAGVDFINLSIHAELGMVALGLNDATTALSEFRAAVRYALVTTVSENSALALIGIAEIAVSAKQEISAARILASVDRWLRASGYRQSETEAKLAKEAVRRAKRQIGAEAFARAWEEGALLSIQEAAELALSLDIHLTSSPQAAAAPVAGARNFKLTKQERKVLCLMAAGETNQQIGDNLFISNRTVAVHVQNILRKLDAENRTHASALAYLAGICLPGPSAHPA